jgi:hypothetical protein
MFLLRRVSWGTDDRVAMLRCAPVVRAMLVTHGAGCQELAEHGLVCMANLSIPDENKEAIAVHLPVVRDLMEAYRGVPGAEAVTHGLSCMSHLAKTEEPSRMGFVPYIPCLRGSVRCVRACVRMRVSVRAVVIAAVAAAAAAVAAVAAVGAPAVPCRPL